MQKNFGSMGGDDGRVLLAEAVLVFYLLYILGLYWEVKFEGGVKGPIIVKELFAAFLAWQPHSKTTVCCLWHGSREIPSTCPYGSSFSTTLLKASLLPLWGFLVCTGRVEGFPLLSIKKQLRHSHVFQSF